jgi:hypothetical protein
MSEQTTTLSTPETAGTPAIRRPEWRDIAEAGGPDGWIKKELARLGLSDPDADTTKLTDAEKKAFKARREEERRVRNLLRKETRRAFQRAHLVHVGAGIFYHDTPDIDRFDVEDPATRRQDNELPELKDANALAVALGLSMPRLRWLVFHREVDSGTHYRRWLIPKRTGGQRLISAPKKDLMAAQRWIASTISEHLPVHDAAHGFVAGRSTKTNAAVHAGAEVVVKLDLKDFYPTITFPRVKGLFRKAGFGEQVATVLALLATESPREEKVIRGKTYYVAIGPRSLPQGAPTSPSITNTICLRLDHRLAGLAASLGFRYTRYADDLTFSWRRPAKGGKGKAKPRPPIARLLHAVRKLVVEEGFLPHPDKTRIHRSGRRQQVTGLVVNAAPGRPLARVPRSVVRKLKAAIHNRECGKPGLGENVEQLRGLAAYVHMVDPVRGRRFLERIDKLGSTAQTPSKETE